MNEHPLQSLAAYSQCVAEVLNRPTVQRSAVAVWSASPYTGIAEGEVWFSSGFRLRLREELDFAARLITSYGYEVYRADERLYWYDDFPHPHDPALASTLPHHKHVPPDIKHHRVSAPDISFTTPNLPFLIREIEALIEQGNA
ncbi:MAG: DUF6516 family protein [Candidatus Binatia bacterium]